MVDGLLLNFDLLLALVNNIDVIEWPDFATLATDAKSFLVHIHLLVALNLLFLNVDVLASLVEFLSDFVCLTIDSLDYGAHLFTEVLDLCS